MIQFLISSIGSFSTMANAQSYGVDDFLAGSYLAPNGLNLPYRLFVPKNYNPSRLYPMVLFLHGAGERGTDNRLELTGQTGELAYVNQSIEDVFMLAPQCPAASQWVNVPFSQGSYSIASTPLSNSLAATLSLQASIQRQYNIDSTRLYATGLSMGGYGVWDLIERYPSLYAAAVPMSGGGDPANAVLLVGVPIWDFHGSVDDVVPVSGSRAQINAIRALGGTPIYTEYQGSGHNIWDAAYRTPSLISWTFSQQQVRTLITIAPEPNQTGLLLAFCFSLTTFSIVRFQKGFSKPRS